MSGFVVFEGGDGAGKTTQVGLLVDHLTARGHEVVVTRQPGGTPIGQQIRAMVLAAPGEVALDPRTEFLLFAADKAQHVAEVVRPALARGAVVVSDRYTDSSIAYQGAGRVLDDADLAALLAWATSDLVPDLTVLLDVDPADAVSEKAGRDRIEDMGLDFHQRVREEFLRLAAQAPARYLVVNGRLPIEEIADLVAERVDALLA